MAEPLIEFVEGQPIKPSEVNGNNQNILNRITESASVLNTRITGIQGSIDSAIATVQENLQGDISNLFSSNGLYVVFNKTTSGWYKAYYSDPEHTNRVWVMQGGTLSASSATRTVTFPLAFTASNSYVILKQFGSNDSGGTAAWWVGFWSCTATKAVTRTSGDSDRWFAIGW